MSSAVPWTTPLAACALENPVAKIRRASQEHGVRSAALRLDAGDVRRGAVEAHEGAAASE